MSAIRDEIEALRAEVRRLRSTVQALTEEKKDLEQRLAFLAQELDRTRFTATGTRRVVAVDRALSVTASPTETR